jgi:tetratricopeptide (TPR) repeat protein
MKVAVTPPPRCTARRGRPPGSRVARWATRREQESRGAGARRRRPVVALLIALILPAPLCGQKLHLPASLEELERRAAIDSSDAAAHYNLGLGYWSKKRWDDVEREFRTAIDIEYRFALAHLGLSFLQTARLDELSDRERKTGAVGLVDAAMRERRALYRRAIMFDPFVDHRLAGAIPTPRALRGFLILRVWSSYGSVLEDLAVGRDERAYEHLTRLLRDEPGGRDSASDGFLWLHTLAAVRTDRFDEGCEDLEQLLRRSERGERDSVQEELVANDYRYALATLYQRAGRTEKAARLFRDVLAEDVGMYMAHVRLADLLEANRRWEEALVERRMARELNPDDPTLLMEEAITLGKAGRLGDADSVMQEAVRAAPRDARPLYYLGVVATAAHRTSEAREAFARFLALAPTRYAVEIADAKRRLDGLR